MGYNWPFGWLHRECQVQLSIKESLLRDRGLELEVTMRQLAAAQARWDAATSWLVASATSVEEKLGQALVSFGFTARAQVAIWRNCDVVDRPAYDGTTMAYVHGSRGTIHLASPWASRQDVAEEGLHAAIAWLGLLQGQGKAQEMIRALRLVEADATSEAAVRTMVQGGLQRLNNFGDPFKEEHALIETIRRAGFRRVFPDYFWGPWCAPLLTGAPILTN